MPTAGAHIWTESQAVTLDRGGFSVILGSLTPLNLAFDQPYYLGIAIDGAGELSPRAPLASSPYSLSLRLPFSGSTSNPGCGFSVQNSVADAICGTSTDPGETCGEICIIPGSAGVTGTNQAIYGIGVHGVADNSGTGVLAGSNSGNAIVAESGSGTGVNATSSTGIGVYAASSSNYGLYAYSSSGYGLYASSSSNHGVYGAAGNGKIAVFGDNFGSGYGLAGSGANVGIYAHNYTANGHDAYLGAQCCAGDFYGNVAVHGTLTKSAGSFRIDHPLDPSNKFLSHSFVESPDMMNLYNGNAELNGAGEAWVAMPAWFEALNMQFRYQLTAIGAPGPNLYVAQEIASNRFRIAGGTPGGKVSWQVTGVRHDKYAEKNRIPVEEEKSAQERGHYIHPDLYGAGESQGMESVNHPEVALLRTDAPSSAGRGSPDASSQGVLESRLRDRNLAGAGQHK